MTDNKERKCVGMDILNLRKSGVTLRQIEDELDYRFEANITDAHDGLDLDLFEYSTEELETFEELWDIENGKGYDIADFDGTGMMEIQMIDVLDMFDTDEDAVNQAIKDGVKVIPVEELPNNFDRKYLGWIDTPENRLAIRRYCESA